MSAALSAPSTMSTPTCRHRSASVESSAIPSVVLGPFRLGRAWLLLLTLAACQSGGSKPRPDTSVGEAGLGDVQGSDGSLTAYDGPRETSADAKASDGSADRAAQGTGDSADGIPSRDLGPDPDLGVDASSARADDAAEDAPDDAPEPDFGADAFSPDAELQPADSGSSRVAIDSSEADSARDVSAADRPEDAAPPAPDSAFVMIDSREPVDVPWVSPDTSPEVGTDSRDAAWQAPDTPDSNLALDSRPGLDSQDGRGTEVGSDGGSDGGGPCCGCLCRDPSWSCSQDTCVDPAGHALTLAAESGFFELAGGSYVSESQTRTSPIHRIWYAFQPAATSPEGKPLAVFFNGGPGSATSVYLFSLNTAPSTLDPAVAGTAKIATNPNSWAQFANLLYIDAPGTGFSYPLALADGSKPSVGIDIDRDAGAFLRVVVRFLARHPRLQTNPVIIVGESYGGTRATLMLDHLFTYQTLAGTTAAYRDLDLYNDLLAHFAAVWPADDPKTIAAAKIATQFGWQVLIQPVVAGDAQWSRQTPDTSVCLSTARDGYQCNEPSGWSNQIATTIAQNLTTIAVLRQALGVDPTTIEWFHASARKTVYGRSYGTFVDTPEMTTTFGALTSEDKYLLIHSSAAGSIYEGVARSWHDPAIGKNFLADLVHASTFITNAKYDTVVWTPAIAPGLASFTDTVASAVIDSAPRTGITRPGWIKVTYVAGVIPAPTTREIRFPSYSNAGHMASVRDPTNLLADVMQWYQASPHASPAHAQPSAELMSLAPLESRELPATPPAPASPVLFIGP